MILDGVIEFLQWLIILDSQWLLWMIVDVSSQIHAGVRKTLALLCIVPSVAGLTTVRLVFCYHLFHWGIVFCIITGKISYIYVFYHESGNITLTYFLVHSSFSPFYLPLVVHAVWHGRRSEECGTRCWLGSSRDQSQFSSHFYRRWPAGCLLSPP